MGCTPLGVGTVDRSINQAAIKPGAINLQSMAQSVLYVKRDPNLF